VIRELTQEALERAVAAPSRPDEIRSEVARCYGVTVEEIMSLSRVLHIARARKALYAELRAIGWSYPAIAYFCGRKDHTTIMKVLKRVRST
jgi:chromosomal replication initiation ATPase DnaA